MIRTEHRRLAHLFGLLLAAGCTSREIPFDATVPVDTAQPEYDATLPPDAEGDVWCGVSVALRTDGEVEAGDEVDPACVYTFPCGLPNGVTVVGCDLYAPGQGPLDARAFGCWLVEGQGCSDGQAAAPDGSVVVDCTDCLGGVGRASEGVVPLERVRAQTALAAWFAKMAHDEAASIWAFERFECELRHRGAPRSIVRAARAARRDEVRHSRVMARHARRLGATVTAPKIQRTKRVRSLEAIAIENAVEGVVNETFGALVATVQARMFAPKLRKTFARIAHDETRHAALARVAARWMLAELPADARARVADAKRAAIAALVAKPAVAEFSRRFLGGTRALAEALDA